MRKRIVGAACGGAAAAAFAAALLGTGMANASVAPEAVRPLAAKPTPVPLLVPAPAKMKLSPDPNSPACRKAPSTTFCSPDSVRYVVTGTTRTAHARWLPVLKKWGITNVNDICVSAPQTAGQQCAILANHGSKRVTVFFKTAYDKKYAPARVDALTDAIHAKAMADVAKATSVQRQAVILSTARAKITALQKAAADYNRKHPFAVVNVIVD